MKFVECGREQDVLDALACDRWPDRSSDDLRAHVEECAHCGDVIAAVRPIVADRSDLSSEGHIPSSGAMWWRAQMRARQEAAREAARPITVAQIVGILCATGVAGVAIAWLSPVVRSWLVESTASITAGMRGIEIGSVLLSQGWLVLLMASVWLVLAPLAIYFAVAED